MTKLVKDDGRTHIQSKLMRESLQDRQVLSGTDSSTDRRILPGITLVSIGGQSIFDRGKDAILPLVDLMERERNIGREVIFTGIEVAAVAFSSAILGFIVLDGRSNWIEGLQLVAAYIIMAVSFFFL